MIISRLPLEYQEVEYLASSGTQYINAEISAQSNNVVYECAWTETTLETGASLFGSTNKSSSTAKWSVVLYHPSAGSVYLATAASDELCQTSGIVANTKNTAVVTANNGTITLNLNGTIVTASYSGSIVNGVNIGLFADLTSSGIQEYCMYTRMYYWKMWDGGVLVAELVPCYRKSDNAAGMYDLVRGKFFTNAGTGTFTVGANVGGTIITAGGVIPIKYALRRRMMIKPARLPAGYQEVKYLESSGTQRLVVDVIPNQDTRIDIIAMPFSVDNTSAGTGFTPYGVATQYDSNAFECYSAPAGALEFNYDGQYQTGLGSISANTKLYISHNKNNITVTNESGQSIASHSFTYRSFTCPRKLALFAINRSSVTQGAGLRIYSCQIYQNGTLVLDLVPCYRIADGVAGMFNLVNDAFYSNAGTGTFAVGSDV